MDTNDLAAITAPDQAATAAPAPEPDNSTPEPKPAETPKTFTQEELDAIVSKRLAREQRKWEREQAQKQTAQPPAPPPEPLKPDDFTNAQAYADALAERKAQELLAQRAAEAERQATLDAYQDREEEPGPSTTTLNRSPTTRSSPSRKRWRRLSRHPRSVPMSSIG